MKLRVLYINDWIQTYDGVQTGGCCSLQWILDLEMTDLSLLQWRTAVVVEAEQWILHL